jgi:hypothetical protein
MLQCNGKVLQCNNDATPMQQIATERERREREEKSRVDKEIEKSTVEADEEEIREETPHMASSPSEKKKPSKKCFGDYKHVRLTEDEFNRLENEYGSVNTEEAIKYLDEYIEMKGTKYKNHNLVLRKWVFDAVKEKKRKANNNNGNKKSAFGQTSRARVAQELDETYSMLADWAET